MLLELLTLADGSFRCKLVAQNLPVYTPIHIHEILNYFNGENG